LLVKLPKHAEEPGQQHRDRQRLIPYREASLAESFGDSREHLNRKREISTEIKEMVIGTDS
jgi:hypothetical protein